MSQYHQEGKWGMQVRLSAQHWTYRVGQAETDEATTSDHTGWAVIQLGKMF